MRNYFFACCIILAAACTEEKLMLREYPRVETLAVGMTSDKIVFNGEIFASGDVDATDHGFTWSTSFPNIRDSPKLSLGQVKSTGAFKASVDKTLFEKNKTYTVRAYSLAGKFEVYGPVQSFVVK
jgi:hypothetical protein